MACPVLQRIPVRSFVDYVRLYVKPQQQGEDGMPSVPVIHETVNDRWEVAVTASDNGVRRRSVSAVQRTSRLSRGG